MQLVQSSSVRSHSLIANLLMSVLIKKIENCQGSYEIMTFDGSLFYGPTIAYFYFALQIKQNYK